MRRKLVVAVALGIPRCIKQMLRHQPGLKSGALRSILLVSSLNFDLKSSEEQDAIIGQYQSFLNSLDFPIQIVVSSGVRGAACCARALIFGCCLVGRSHTEIFGRKRKSTA